MLYSATPVAPQIWKCFSATCSLRPKTPLRFGSSSWRLSRTSCFLASFMAFRRTPALVKGIPSSEKATAPLANKASKSVIFSPSNSLVMVATVWTRMSSLAAESRTSLRVSTVEMVGEVLAIITTEVTPPAAAASEPVWISSLWVWPGSRKWTWTSTRPGATTRPVASMTWASAASKSCPIFRIFPFSTKISATWSNCDCGSTTRPFLMMSIDFSFFVLTIGAYVE